METKIDFTLMDVGFDEKTSEFLNWCMQYRDNLEWLKDIKFMELKSASATAHFDQDGQIQRVDINTISKRIIIPLTPFI